MMKYIISPFKKFYILLSCLYVLISITVSLKKKKKAPMINSCVSNIIQSLANTYAHCCKVCGKTCVPRRIILGEKLMDVSRELI